MASGDSPPFGPNTLQPLQVRSRALPVVTNRHARHQPLRINTQLQLQPEQNPESDPYVDPNQLHIHPALRTNARNKDGSVRRTVSFAIPATPRSQNASIPTFQSNPRSSLAVFSNASSSSESSAREVRRHPVAPTPASPPNRRGYELPRLRANRQSFATELAQASSTAAYVLGRLHTSTSPTSHGSPELSTTPEVSCGSFDAELAKASTKNAYDTYFSEQARQSNSTHSSFGTRPSSIQRTHDNHLYTSYDYSSEESTRFKRSKKPQPSTSPSESSKAPIESLSEAPIILSASASTLRPEKTLRASKSASNNRQSATIEFLDDFALAAEGKYNPYHHLQSPPKQPTRAPPPPPTAARGPSAVTIKDGRCIPSSRAFASENTLILNSNPAPPISRAKIASRNPMMEFLESAPPPPAQASWEGEGSGKEKERRRFFGGKRGKGEGGKGSLRGLWRGKKSAVDLVKVSNDERLSTHSTTHMEMTTSEGCKYAYIIPYTATHTLTKKLNLPDAMPRPKHLSITIDPTVLRGLEDEEGTKEFEVWVETLAARAGGDVETDLSQAFRQPGVEAGCEGDVVLEVRDGEIEAEVEEKAIEGVVEERISVKEIESHTQLPERPMGGESAYEALVVGLGRPHRHMDSGVGVEIEVMHDDRHQVLLVEGKDGNEELCEGGLRHREERALSRQEKTRTRKLRDLALFLTSDASGSSDYSESPEPSPSSPLEASSLESNVVSLKSLAILLLTRFWAGKTGMSNLSCGLNEVNLEDEKLMELVERFWEDFEGRICEEKRGYGNGGGRKVLQEDERAMDADGEEHDDEEWVEGNVGYAS